MKTVKAANGIIANAACFCSGKFLDKVEYPARNERKTPKSAKIISAIGIGKEIGIHGI